MYNNLALLYSFNRNYMKEEHTISDVLDAVSNLTGKVVVLEQGFSHIEKSVSELHGAMMAFSDRVDERFAQVDEKFNQVDERFNQVDKRFSEIDSRFDRLENRFGTLTDILQANRVISKYEATQVKNAAVA